MNPVLATFLKTRVDHTPEAYFNLLCDLRPDRLPIKDIAEIVYWIESNHRAPRHESSLNVFGTGGDSTINITSMATVVASTEVHIVKIGTTAVTSLWGAADFFSSLNRYINLLCSSSITEALKLKSDSHFLSLIDIGFAYNTSLRDARRKLRELNIPDIYKIVFPFANYTSPLAQLTGAATLLYYEVFKKLAALMNREACIVCSHLGIDELMLGSNSVAFCRGKNVEEFTFTIESGSHPQVRTALNERVDPLGSVVLLAELYRGFGDRDIREVIRLNACLIIALHTFISKNSGSLQENLKKVAERFHPFPVGLS